MSTVTVRLQRNNPSQPWGFRIHGGVDFNQPLLILKVTAGSLSSQQGLEPGDQIIQINGGDALRLRHRDVQQLIMNAGNQVEFQVLRGNRENLERAVNNGELPISRRSSVKKSSSSFSSTTTSTSMVSMVQSQSYNSTSSATVTQGWSGPKFTEENIKETLTSQAQVLKTGAIGVNFMKNEQKPLDMNKSEVLKMLNELEDERKMRAKSPAPPTHPPSTFGLINRAYDVALQSQQSSAPWVTTSQLSPAPVQ